MRGLFEQPGFTKGPRRRSLFKERSIGPIAHPINQPSHIHITESLEGHGNRFARTPARIGCMMSQDFQNFSITFASRRPRQRCRRMPGIRRGVYRSFIGGKAMYRSKS